MADRLMLLRFLAAITLWAAPARTWLDGGSSLAEGADTPDDATDDVQHIDWAVYKFAKEGVMVDLSTNMGTGGEAMGDTLVNIELIWGSELCRYLHCQQRSRHNRRRRRQRYRVLRGLGDGRHGGLE